MWPPKEEKEGKRLEKAIDDFLELRLEKLKLLIQKSNYDIVTKIFLNEYPEFKNMAIENVNKVMDIKCIIIKTEKRIEINEQDKVIIDDLNIAHLDGLHGNYNVKDNLVK